MRLASRHGNGRRRPQWLLALPVVALGLVGGVGAALSAQVPESENRSAIAAPNREPSATRKQMPVPVRISIPAIGVDARVIPLGLNRDRTMQVPKNFGDAGWFRPGPEPGEQGAAVVVGHVDSKSGPGVFFRLRELRAGQVITIHLHGGSRVQFVAGSMIRVPKGRFPTERVYAKTNRRALRLITCAGKLNPATGHHPDNYIVFASHRTASSEVQ